MDHPTPPRNTPDPDALTTHCPKCQQVRIWAEVIADPPIRERGYSALGVAQTTGHSLLLGPATVYRNARALVCTRCGYTELYTTHPGALASR